MKMENNKLTEEWIDVKKVSEIARSTTVISMQRNQDKRINWRKINIEKHLLLSAENIRCYCDDFNIQRLENALCELAIILTLVDINKK